MSKVVYITTHRNMFVSCTLQLNIVVGNLVGWSLVMYGTVTSPSGYPSTPSTIDPHRSTRTTLGVVLNNSKCTRIEALSWKGSQGLSFDGY